MDSPIITLTTDWGNTDFFAGKVKGRLYSSIPNVRVVDITHGIEPFQLAKAIFVVQNACLGFPKQTIHIIDVTSSQADDRPFVVIEHEGQYYICMDNGLPRALFGSNINNAVAIEGLKHGPSDFRTFAAFDIFCPVAAKLAGGAPLSDLGSPFEDFWPYTPNRPIISGSMLKLYVTYIDHYGNADLNISYAEFQRICAGRKFQMLVRETPLEEIFPGYSYATKAGNGRGALLLTVSATGCLQVALRQASAEQFFNLNIKDAITVLFQ
ncbi:MAG: SAM-dependent chlorinase/fluorinase [Bacteroidales bacterium]|nr:SAM-dependent chlorinase/fluorinase [Bacteroidales bacterium]